LTGSAEALPTAWTASTADTEPTAAVHEATELSTAEPPRQPSLCEPFRAVIQAKLDQGLTAQRIYQDLVTEYGFGGKYHSVRRFVRRLAPEQELPFRRLECGPGEEAQVDFGKGAPTQDAE